jgi:hypothetical protein
MYVEQGRARGGEGTYAYGGGTTKREETAEDRSFKFSIMTPDEAGMITNSDAVNTKNPDTFVGGRVVRLHFACHAELPIGSLLRVTGSSLLTSKTIQSKGDEDYSSSQHQQQEFDVLKDAFASSIEMVTSPDTYPIWRTRRPVTVTLHPTTTTTNTSAESTTTQYHAHRYRYLVVTPGATAKPALTGTTSCEVLLGTGSTSMAVPYTQPITEWEYPPAFIDSMELSMDLTHCDTLDPSIHGAHAMRCAHHKRLPSSGNELVKLGDIAKSNAPLWTAKYIANLPFRTILVPLQDISLLSASSAARIDRWNDAQDEAWIPFIEISQMVCKLYRRKIFIYI